MNQFTQKVGILRSKQLLVDLFLATLSVSVDKQGNVEVDSRWQILLQTSHL